VEGVSIAAISHYVASWALCVTKPAKSASRLAREPEIATGALIPVVV
jgi:uncharacterized membrane-anchored protein